MKSLDRDEYLIHKWLCRRFKISNSRVTRFIEDSNLVPKDENEERDLDKIDSKEFGIGYEVV